MSKNLLGYKLPLFMVMALALGILTSCSSSSDDMSNVQPVTITGSLPTDAQFKSAIDEAYNKFKGDTSGKNADYIPYLAKVDSKLFGIAIVTRDGKVFTKGDSDYGFAIESVAKPFALALAMKQNNAQTIVDKLGVEPTGRPFNSMEAVKDLPGHIGNPVVNAGAIATVSLIKASSADAKWNLILDYLSKFAGEKLPLNKEVYDSEAATNDHNKEIGKVLKDYGRLYSDSLEAVDVYTKECSINVTAKQLAVMGATLANGGVNPISKEQVVPAKNVPKLLAVMTMAGFYDESGLWAYTTGLPSKTGVGGGIVSVVPGKYSIVAFSPPLDTAGNSVKAAKAIQYIAKKLGANIFTATK